MTETNRVVIERNLLPTEREKLIDFIARERAEMWVCYRDDGVWKEAEEFGKHKLPYSLSDKDEDFYYAMARHGTGVPDWDEEFGCALEKKSDSEILGAYQEFYSVDLSKDDRALCEMDKFVRSLLFPPPPTMKCSGCGNTETSKMLFRDTVERLSSVISRKNNIRRGAVVRETTCDQQLICSLCEHPVE